MDILLHNIEENTRRLIENYNNTSLQTFYNNLNYPFMNEDLLFDEDLQIKMYEKCGRDMVWKIRKHGWSTELPNLLSNIQKMFTDYIFDLKIRWSSENINYDNNIPCQCRSSTPHFNMFMYTNYSFIIKIIINTYKGYNQPITHNINCSLIFVDNSKINVGSWNNGIFCTYSGGPTINDWKEKFKTKPIFKYIFPIIYIDYLCLCTYTEQLSHFNKFITKSTKQSEERMTYLNNLISSYRKKEEIQKNVIINLKKELLKKSKHSKKNYLPFNYALKIKHK